MHLWCWPITAERSESKRRSHPHRPTVSPGSIGTLHLIANCEFFLRLENSPLDLIKKMSLLNTWKDHLNLTFWTKARTARLGLKAHLPWKQVETKCTLFTRGGRILTLVTEPHGKNLSSQTTCLPKLPEPTVPFPDTILPSLDHPQMSQFWFLNWSAYK